MYYLYIYSNPCHCTQKESSRLCFMVHYFTHFINSQVNPAQSSSFNSPVKGIYFMSLC